MDWIQFLRILLTNILIGNQSLGKMRQGQDDLYPGGLTMGNLFIGRPGTGKTSLLAYHLFNYFKAHPDRAIFVLDWSGSITDMVFYLIAQDPEYEKYFRRVIYDELGNPDWVIPMPEFSSKYGHSEEQVQRVKENLKRMNQDLIEKNPTLGGLALESSQDFFRVCTSITNEHCESWQITEVKKLVNNEALLKLALKKYGEKVPESKYSLENGFLKLKEQEKHMRIFALTTLLSAIEPREIRARVGYFQPGWTPKEAIEKGSLVIINGARLINREAAQNYLFTQVYSLLLQEINKRIPADPTDKPVSMVLDEVYSLLSIPGMAKEIGQLSPLYRSRKVILYVVLQSLSQLAKPLDEQIWSLGNIVSFALSDFNEAYKMGQQLFIYDPNLTRLPAATVRNMPLLETDRGQYLTLANWIQRLNHRECIMRRFLTEKQLEGSVIHVQQTRSHPSHKPFIDVQEAKVTLLRQRGVSVRDALEVINQRKIDGDQGIPEQVRGTPPRV